MEIFQTFHLAEVLAIGALFLTGFGYMMAEMRRLEAKIDQQGIRTDRLYEMFIDLVKEGKK